MKRGRLEHGKHGWFKAGPRRYEELLKVPCVRLLWESYGDRSQTRVSAIYQFMHFLDLNKLSPDELLELSDDEIKAAIRKAVVHKNADGKYGAARLMFYTVRRFFEINGRNVFFSRREKRLLIKKIPNQIVKQYIPSREDIYRMVDSFPRKAERQWLRGRALLLCLWQSGVRANCLCSWTWGIFQDHLYPRVQNPVRIKVVAKRPSGVYEVAEDSKLSSYAVNYYYTFLHEEAARALKAYLDARMNDDWNPKLGDLVFVTEGNLEETKNNPLSPKHINEIVKRAASQIGIPADRVWTHCFRKAFRKTLYRGGLDPDVCEALMGHKLPASRGSYFDYHDVSFAEEEYLKAPWERLDLDQLRRLEKEVLESRKIRDERIEELEAEIADLRAAMLERDDLKKRLERLEKTLVLLSGP